VSELATGSWMLWLALYYLSCKQVTWCCSVQVAYLEKIEAVYIKN